MLMSLPVLGNQSVVPSSVHWQYWAVYIHMSPNVFRPFVYIQPLVLPLQGHLCVSLHLDVRQLHIMWRGATFEQKKCNVLVSSKGRASHIGVHLKPQAWKKSNK